MVCFIPDLIFIYFMLAWFSAAAFTGNPMAILLRRPLGWLRYLSMAQSWPNFINQASRQYFVRVIVGSGDARRVISLDEMIPGLEVNPVRAHRLVKMKLGLANQLFQLEIGRMKGSALLNDFRNWCGRRFNNPEIRIEIEVLDHGLNHRSIHCFPLKKSNHDLTRRSA